MTQYPLLYLPLLGCLLLLSSATSAETPPDDAVWHAHRVIDAHGHVGEFEGYDLDLEHLLANAERYGVHKVLVSNIDGAELEQTANLAEGPTNERTLALVRRHPDVLRGLVWTRPTDGDAAEVSRFLDERLPNGDAVFVGLKIHPVMNGFPADDPRVDPYFDLAAERGIPVAFHCDAPGTDAGPERIVAAAARHPEVPVILYHMGFKKTHGPAIDTVAEALEAGKANLYLGTAQADPAAVVGAVERLGAERIVFGTDAVYYGAEHYARYEPMVEALRQALATEDLALVLGGNARRLFGL